jgi:hypothetical protein
MGKWRKGVVALGMPLAMVAGMATPATANTGGGDVAACQHAFATQGLALIRAFQMSAKDAHANLVLQIGLTAAERLFVSCIDNALRVPPPG